MLRKLSEYIAELDERRDLIWPQPPDPVSLKATPSLKAIPGVRAVLWNVYGTLLQIDGGRLVHLHPQELRMQVALDKTIKEFNMWQSMSRKPGLPWEYLLRQYKTFVEEMGMVSTKKKGEVPEIDSAKLWSKVVDRLVKNEYHWDDHYGDQQSYCACVAYFFHASLQGTVASLHAWETLQRLSQAGMRNGLLADAQIFTVPQLLRDLGRQGDLKAINELFSPSLFVLSSQTGRRKPSPSLFQEAVSQLQGQRIAPQEVLYVSHQFQDDLDVARRYGFHTVLYAVDKNSCRVSGPELRNSAHPPERLVTDLLQVLELLQI